MGRGKVKSAENTAPAIGAVPLIEGNTIRMDGKLMLSDLLPAGGQYERVRQQIISQGVYEDKELGKKLYVRTSKEGDDYRVMALAAVAIPRDPGLSQNYIDQVQDYVPILTQGNRTQQLRQLWQIYQTEGIINNAVNKIAAILSTGGRFKVRDVKKGKKQNAVAQLQAALDEFVRRVNNSPLDAVVTGDRGLQMVTHQGVRSCLVEGDWIGRTVWVDHTVGSYGTFSMPMTIQTIQMEQISTDSTLDGTGIEFFYWQPPAQLVNLLKSNKADKNLKQVVQKFFPKDIQKQLINGGKALLDPALLLHVKHRGVPSRTFGESFIWPAKPALAFKRSVEALDFVTMQSLINRLTIVCVGTSDPNSPYSKTDVALARTALMQSFFDQTGPNMTIIWEGDDVEVKQVSAHSAMLDLTDRHTLADQKVKLALGVPDALLAGTTADGKSAGWAAVIGASAQLEELQNAFSGVWTTVGERIALENNFTDIDIVFEFDRSLLADKSDERMQNRNDYVVGGLTIKDYIAGMGKDPDAAFVQRCTERGLDPASTTWEEAFMPPQGLQGQGAPSAARPDQMSEPKSGAPGGGSGGGDGQAAPPQGQGTGKTPGAGRAPNKQTGAPTKKAPTEKKTPVENK